MIVCKVVGHTWATRKHHSLDNLRLLLVQQIDPISGKKEGDIMMAVAQKINAGPGDTVLVMDEGSSTRFVLGDERAPIRTTIVGIIDSVYQEGKTVKFH